jgi:hypothetical protein
MARWDGPAASQGAVFALRWRGMVVRGDAVPVRVALRLFFCVPAPRPAAELTVISEENGGNGGRG